MGTERRTGGKRARSVHPLPRLETEDFGDGRALRRLTARGVRARAVQLLLAVAEHADPGRLLAPGRPQLGLEFVANLRAAPRRIRLSTRRPHLLEPRAREGTKRGLDLGVLRGHRWLRRPFAERELSFQRGRCGTPPRRRRRLARGGKERASQEEQTQATGPGPHSYSFTTRTLPGAAWMQRSQSTHSSRLASTMRSVPSAFCAKM